MNRKMLWRDTYARDRTDEGWWSDAPAAWIWWYHTKTPLCDADERYAAATVIAAATCAAHSPNAIRAALVADQPITDEQLRLRAAVLVLFLIDMIVAAGDEKRAVAEILAFGTREHASHESKAAVQELVAIAEHTARFLSDTDNKVACTRMHAVLNECPTPIYQHLLHGCAVLGAIWADHPGIRDQALMRIFKIDHNDKGADNQ